jgi:hypothetical protein
MPRCLAYLSAVQLSSMVQRGLPCSPEPTRKYTAMALSNESSPPAACECPVGPS